MESLDFLPSFSCESVCSLTSIHDHAGLADQTRPLDVANALL